MSESPIADQQGAVDLSSMMGGDQGPAAQQQQAALAAQRAAAGQHPGAPGGMPRQVIPGAPGGPGAPASPIQQAPPSAPGAGAPGQMVSAPLITDVNERNFEEAMALSQTVPIVLLLYTPKSLASKNALDVLESVARQDAGAFQLGRVDVEANPTLASAFQAQSVPAAFAVIGRRPVPLFEGVPTEVQLQQMLEELFQVSAQLGVTGRIEVSEEDLERPTPEEHLPARAAEEEGNWDEAVSAWKKVLANNPGDREAKTALVRAQFQARQEQESSADAEDTVAAEATEADTLFAKGQESKAFDLLLNAMEQTDDPEQKEELRTRLVELFQIAADSGAVKAARSRLATMLMV